MNLNNFIIALVLAWVSTKGFSLSLQYPDYLIDPKGSLDFSDVVDMKFEKSTKANPSFGWTSDIVWLKTSFEK